MHCADLWYMSVTCTTLKLGVPLVAWGNLWSAFQGKEGMWKERKIRFVHSGQAWVLSQLSVFSICLINIFCTLGKHSPCSENRVGNRTAVWLYMQQQRAAMRRAWVGLCWVLASSVAAHTSHLQASQSLQTAAALWGRSKTGIQPTTLEDLGHPVVAILISEEAVCLDTYFSSYLLLFLFFSPDILKAI